MRYPFNIDLSGGLENAGFDVTNNASMVDSTIAVMQLVHLDGIPVRMRIMIKTDQDTRIVTVRPHFDQFTMSVEKTPKGDSDTFYRKFKEMMLSGCKKLEGTYLRLGRPGVQGSIKETAKR